MPILFRWQFHALLVHLFLTQAALLSIFVIIEGFDKSRLLGHHGMTGSVMVEYILLKAPFMVAEFMPLTLLIASVVHLLQMARHREIVVLRACGLGIGKVAAPMVAVAIVAIMVTLLFDEWVTPITNVRLNYIERVHVHGQQIADQRKRHWYRDGNRFFRVEPLSGERVALLVIDTDDRGRWLRRIDSSEARYRDGVWQMRGVVISTPDNAQGVSVTRLDEMRLPAGKGSVRSRQAWPNEMNAWQLWRFAQRLRALGMENSGYRYALQRKLAQPLSCLLMVLVALAFCSEPRSGRGGGDYRGMVAAVVFGLLFYISGNATSMLAGGGRLPAEFAAWLPNLVYGGLALFIFLQHLEAPSAGRRKS